MAYQELVSYGLDCNSCDFSLPEARSILHRHNDVELILVQENSLRFLFGGVPHTLEPGRFGVLWAAVPHYVVHTEPHSTLHWLTLPLADCLAWQLPRPLARAI